MNVGNSTRIALLKKNKNQAWLCEKLETSSQRVSFICNSPLPSGRTIQTLADVFEMKCSEFIALGEG